MKAIIKTVSVMLLACVMLVGCRNADNSTELSKSQASSTVSENLTGNISSTDGTVSETVSKNNPSNEVSSNMSSVLNSSSVTSSSAPVEEFKQPEWKKHPEDYKLIALTFDDAPAFKSADNNATVRIIKALNDYEGTGTLFTVGSTLNSNGKALLEYAVKRGFEIGNHTYSHRSVSTDSLGKTWTASENKEDIVKCQNIIKENVGITPKSFRPAGAHTNEALYSATAELGLPPIVGNRNVAVSDWNDATTVEQIIERVLENSYDGAIILLHSTSLKTAEATESVCRVLYEDGYRFCTVEELFEFKGKSYSDVPENSIVYGFDPETDEIQTTKKY